MSDPKELNFFVESRNWGRGLSWYRQQFSPSRGVSAIGEASPQYAMAHCFPGVPARIVATLPQVKVIYVVREPVARIQSHFLHDVAAGIQILPIGEAVRSDLGYLHTSRYGYQLEAYLEHVDAEQVLVVDSERLRTDREATLRRIFAFIGVDPTFVPDNLDRVAHTSASKGIDEALATLSTEDRRLLEHALRPEVEPLRGWLGPDFDGWGLLV